MTVEHNVFLLQFSDIATIDVITWSVFHALGDGALNVLQIFTISRITCDISGKQNNVSRLVNKIQTRTKASIAFTYQMN